MRDTEGGEPGEGHHVGAEAGDSVHQLDDRLCEATAAPAASGVQADEGEREPSHDDQASEQGQQPAADVPAGRGETGTEEQRGAGYPARRVEGQRPATLPDPVHGAYAVRAGQQQRAQADRGNQ